jgi:hypothetical protein
MEPELMFEDEESEGETGFKVIVKLPPFDGDAEDEADETDDEIPIEEDIEEDEMERSPDGSGWSPSDDCKYS